MAEDTTVRRDGPSRESGPGRVLVVRDGSVTAVELPKSGSVVVGRSDDADVVVDDEALSRRHARIDVGARVEIVDLGSSNGTSLRGSRLVPETPGVLMHGDAVELGGTLLVLEWPGKGGGVTPASTPMEGGALARVHEIADRVATSLISVLILGETGVGKGVLARRVHDRSPRHLAPFLALNCAALPESLLESELLGHERGAFTGAVETKPGLLETADGGTVFLDEVGELPLTVQAKLLRVIEERQVMRIGGRSPRSADVRFVAATNRDLSVESARGTFRTDLYYRLNGISLIVPPLRERREEIEDLALRFVKEAAQGQGVARPRFAPEVLEFFAGYAWPGNIRELRNVVERAVVLCRDGEIAMADLHLEGYDPRGEAAPSGGAASAPPKADVASADPERARIEAALEQFAGNQTRAAKSLGMSRTTLSARLDAYGIPRPRKRRNGQ